MRRLYKVNKKVEELISQGKYKEAWDLAEKENL
jgi:hypothetical protein